MSDRMHTAICWSLFAFFLIYKEALGHTVTPRMAYGAVAIIFISTVLAFRGPRKKGGS